jgi:hypothetical protein
VSLRLQLLQVARLAPRLLGESTDLVRDFYRRQFNEHGAACDRAGKPDLYYTIFAIAGALSLDVPLPLGPMREWLLTFDDGAALDLVHLGALARCWAEMGEGGIPKGLDQRLLDNIETFRKPDGGYDVDKNQPHGTAYGAFVALGAWQDLGRTPPRILDLVRCFKHLESSDGGWSNQPGMRIGALNATAGAVTLIRHLGFPVNQSVADWLLAQAHPQGGFKATPSAPIPDLLSTATALHALSAMDCRIPSALHERCLDFIDTLWDAGGGFHGHWADDFLDPEYTFYGLLALGHLSLR